MLLPEHSIMKYSKPAKKKKPWTEDFIQGVKNIVDPYPDLRVEFRYEIFGTDQE